MNKVNSGVGKSLRMDYGFNFGFGVTKNAWKVLELPFGTSSIDLRMIESTLEGLQVFWLYNQSGV